MKRYNIDFSKAEKISWGKDQGCSFIESSCSNHLGTMSEFCDEQYLGCSKDSFFRTKCMTTFFSNTCKMRIFFDSCKNRNISKQMFETYSESSQCHYYKNYWGTTAGCVETVCDYSKMVYSIVSKTVPFEHVCQYKGQEHTQNSATFICQDPKEICKKKLNCPANCNGRGICMENHKCHCNTFYKGDICQEYTGCLNSNQNLCSMILISNFIDQNNLANDYETEYFQFNLDRQFFGSNINIIHLTNR
jgi:hypothetical protein